MAELDCIESLRSLYRAPGERALRKQLDRLDVHCRAFIARSPFLVLASGDADGRLDASPRGGDPGFVTVLDERRLLIPDAPGNNRLDSLSNLVASPGIGLLFMIPGVDETLRVNGRASLSTDPDLLERCANERRRPPLVIAVEVRDAYLHCAKALMRSKLWHPDSIVERRTLPTMGQMLKDQIGLQEDAESQEEMALRYQKDL